MAGIIIYTVYDKKGNEVCICEAEATAQSLAELLNGTYTVEMR